MGNEDCAGIWVLAEQESGKLKTSTLGLLAMARALAGARSTRTTAVLLGHGIEKLCADLVRAGADEVLAVDHELLARYSTGAYAKVLSDLASERNPEVLLLGATALGRDLGPRVAARLGTGLTAGCASLAIDPETGVLEMKRLAFGGSLVFTVECARRRPQMAMVIPAGFGAITLDAHRRGEVERINPSLTPADMMVESVERLGAVLERPDLAEARIIVAGGRGARGREGFGLLEELAVVLGGTVGASRAAVDAGWADDALQVGHTGKIVRPQVYIACGVSGAAQHLAGMRESEFIIAINTDEYAPIMKIADMAIVGDLFEVVPALISRITSGKADGGSRQI